MCSVMHTEGTLTHTTVSTMDTECMALLPQVCEVLADSGRSLPDDTSLEKLLDWFTGLNKAGGCLLTTCPCLLEFISTVISNSTSDPAVLSFTIKLTGLMAATEDGFRTLQECSALNLVFNLQPWHEAGLWDDPCIRIGWIQGIRSMLLHPKALRFFVQSDFIDPLLQLQTDPSLFVASAANQLLAHILQFFQPKSFPTRNDNDKKAADGERTRTCFKASTAIDTEHLVLDMENPSEYTAVVMMICQYLKESLVPKEKAQIHQSEQTLKLLVLLLNQARPPLRDELLRSVLDSLETLVKSKHSQLTLPLMDAVLAANSSPGANEQGVTHLLSSMLEMNKPSELIQAAAAFLHRGPCDSTHTPKAVRTLLLPLDIITGHCLAGADTAADQSWSQMQEQLMGKTSCISIICICLTNTVQITLMPPDVLPCHPGLIISEVVSLLRICGGDSFSSSSIDCTEASRNIVGSGKVQKCALEALAALSNCSGAKDKVNEVFPVLITYLDNPNSDPTVLHKTYHALVKWTSVWTDVITEQLRQDLIKVVKKRVCDMRWEVRDSTVEFVGKLAYLSDALLDDCCTTPLLREALQDQESYVRASAVSALAHTLTHSWQQGAAPTQEQTDIVDRLLEVLSEDTEGFARRAVVKFFISWFSSHTPPSSSSSSSSLLMKSVRSVLSLGSADLDWEVKVHTLELAELLMDAALSGQRRYRKDRGTDPAPSHPYAVASAGTHSLHTHTSGQTSSEESSLVGALESLVEVGVVSVLLCSLFDCDRPVGLKACRLLVTLRETVCSLDGTATMATASTVTCEMPCRGWGQEITKTLGQTTRRSVNGADEAESVECDDVSAGVGSVCVSVCDVLRSLGLDDRLTVLSRSSDHVHNSPLSLLQDILTATAAHTHTDSQTEELVVDCY